jgi:hypothetical protein
VQLQAFLADSVPGVSDALRATGDGVSTVIDSRAARLWRRLALGGWGWGVGTAPAPRILHWPLFSSAFRSTCARSGAPYPPAALASLSARFCRRGAVDDLADIADRDNVNVLYHDTKEYL